MSKKAWGVVGQLFQWGMTIVPALVGAIMDGKGKSVKEALTPFLTEVHLDALDEIIEDPEITAVNTDIDELLE